MYQAYQATNDAFVPTRTAAAVAMLGLGLLPAHLQSPLTLHLAGLAELTARTRVTHEHPPWGIPAVSVAGKMVPVTEEVIDVTPFATLLRFATPGADRQPKMLVVAPLSGHFATLLRHTVRTLSSDHDVYVTDWHNARDVPIEAGAFGFDEFVAHVIRFQEVLGPGSHLLSVCQPCVPALAAVALMAEDDNPSTPRTMIMMAGPVDGRKSPTAVNELALTRPIGWFERNVISTVPLRYAGANRQVYPGFLQLSAFMSMNVGRHLKVHLDLYRHVVCDDKIQADGIRVFYDEYGAVLDLPAEFYLETVQRVFQEFQLAVGTLDWRGRRVDPGAIRGTALLTVEGERDDVCGIGQTSAALDLCRGVPRRKKLHRLQPGVGHYGVFSGRRWETEVYPAVRDFVQRHA